MWEETGEGGTWGADGGVSIRVRSCYPIQFHSPNWKKKSSASGWLQNTVWRIEEGSLQSLSPLDWAPLERKYSVKSAVSMALEKREDFSEMGKGKMSSLWHKGSEQGL